MNLPEHRRKEFMKFYLTQESVCLNITKSIHLKFPATRTFEIISFTCRIISFPITVLPHPSFVKSLFTETLQIKFLIKFNSPLSTHYQVMLGKFKNYMYKHIIIFV